MILKKLLTGITLLFGLTGMLSAQAVPSGIMPNVSTRAFDNLRTGANTSESILTPANLKARGIRKYFGLPLEGDARGTEGQPLILPNVKMEDGIKRDVVIIASMNNLVFAFDANTSDILWTKKLGVPIKGGPSIDMHLINDHWGVLSTGVIDPDTGIYYCVGWTSPDGTPQKASNYIYSIDISTGNFAHPSVPLAGITYLPPGGTLQRFNSTMRKQRSSLVMTNVKGVKTIFFASGTVLETSAGSAGWVMAYDVATNSIATAMTMTAGSGAGVWMGGQGLAADPDGFLYGESGNGNFNGVNNFGECAFKLQYIPASGTTQASLKVVDWWSPYSDAARIGQPVTTVGMAPMLGNKLSGVSAPTENSMTEDAPMPVNGMKKRNFAGARMVGNLMYPPLGATNNAAWADEDLGSAQGALVYKYGVFLVGGKDGISYPVNSNNMGKTVPSDFANAKANCAKLVSPPIWATASPGPVDPCPQDPTTLNFLPWGKTRHQHSTPVQYMSPINGQMIFIWGENSQLHAWGMAPNGTITYLAQGNEVASINSTNPPGGMPGGFCSLSSNNNVAGSSILWCTIPYGDANATITNGRLLAYDPDNFITNADGSKTLAVLWDSEKAAFTFLFNKFDPPVVAGGKVFVPNYSGSVDVYGLN